MQLTGSNLIAGIERAEGDSTYRSVSPETGVPFGPHFHDATDEEIAAAAAAAEAAFPALRGATPETVAGLLNNIADRLEALGDDLVQVAVAETGLDTTRIVGERGRTCGQLRAFADVVSEGSHLDLHIDTEDPNTQPPRPDLRRMQIPIGPVAVFGASNFPLAFSVPGGDTASALAAGCPAVVKVHPSHPATSELCGRVISEAVDDAGLPGGVFSLLHGRDVRVSRNLVLAPQIKAVGFTGSKAAGRALFDLGASRDEPIPVYAEMGSLNPLFITPRALEERAEDIAEGLLGSVTMGTGQFCTKPGLVFVPDTPAGRSFERKLSEEAAATAPGLMLNEGIHRSLEERLTRARTLPGVEVLAAPAAASETGFRTAPTLLAVDRKVFERTPELAQEHFGPVTVIVRCDSVEDMAEVAQSLDGALTATLHATDDDAAEVGPLYEALRELAGRVVWNQFPTGVAVTHAMHHGGPYPATTSPAHTSVGTAAIRRFLRPVTYQNVPRALLPEPLRDENPRKLMRLVHGRYHNGPLT